MAPLAEPVPPKFYGVTKRVIFWLTDEYRSVINSSLRRADQLSLGASEATFPPPG
jgi:hypothetical protein